MNMRLALSLSFLFIVPAALHAGDIQGQILNAQGAALAGAKITVANQQEAARWEAETAADGTYSVTGIGSGTYLVTVAAPGGGPALRREVSVPGGTAVARADFQFPPTAASSSAASSSSGVSTAEERNPNVFIYRIDLNALRNRVNVGRGPDPVYVPEFSVEQNYFGAEFGAPLFVFQPLRPRALAAQWRATLFGMHQNSALNARNFFNVGPLRASRSTNYSLTGGGPLFTPKASLLLQFGQNFTSGFVNGNVTVPRADEQTPLSSDPQVNAVIASLLGAYPAELPNLGDPETSHRLNSNALRDVKAKDGLARLDYKPTDSTSLAGRYSINDYAEDPFQLVAGRNPQTDLRSQSAYASLTRAFSPQTLALFGFHYDRSTASLKPTRLFSDLFASLGLAAVPDVNFTSDQINDLGPGTQFPRLRVQNRFQSYFDISHARGRHTLKAGWSSTRVQVNDLQSDNSRGTLLFSSGDFGRTELENFLVGTPSSLTITLGNLYRGFRSWQHSFYFGDQIQLGPTLTVGLGLRYELVTAPVEVNNLTQVGYPTDKNNFAPRIGFAWNPARGKTTLRGSYGISYGALFPVTYGMTRFNSPATQTLQVFAPDLLDTLAGSSQQPTEGGRSSVWRLSPDLVLPYSHQYTFGIERALPWAGAARIAYTGMRTIHLVTHQIYNRARASSTLPNTSRTINDRRPDQRFFDIHQVESTSIAYYDALHLSMDKKLSQGLSLQASYTFGKNIDLGGDFTNTASGVDKPPEDGTPTCEVCDHFSDHKGLSLFDTTNILTLRYSYDLPFPAGQTGLLATLLGGWQISGTTIFQSGTPFHAHTGSDGPGFGNVDGTGHDRPNLLDPSILGMSIDDPDTSMQLWSRDFFDTNIAPGGRGNIGLNVFRKDGTSNWNFAFGRTFHLPGAQERSLQFRSEFINLFNHPQFAKPGVQIAGGTFGEITNTANKGRQVQFSLRLNF